MASSSLKAMKQLYDVIITDSSDPGGPAKSLFQKPYFQLLHDALAPGGHISTQGECLWLHLRELRLIKSTQDLFATTEYAYTTIPTYPSGQIAKPPTPRTPVEARSRQMLSPNSSGHFPSSILPLIDPNRFTARFNVALRVYMCVNHRPIPRSPGKGAIILDSE